MKSIETIIEEHEVARRNELRFNLGENLIAAVKVGSLADATRFLINVMQYEFNTARKIVSEIRNNSDFNQATYSDLEIKSQTR